MSSRSVHRTYCKFCVAKCGVVVEVEGDRVVRVMGDPEHPLSGGYLCAKGRALGRLHHHPDRLDVPTVGRGAQRSSPGWDSVLGDLADRLRVLVRDGGPATVAAYGGNGGAQDNVGFALLNRFLRALGSRNWYTALTIDSPAKGLVAELVGGYSGLVAHPGEDCRLVLVIGSNPVVSHGHTTALPDPITWMRRVTAAGECWVLDPRRTETARQANHHIAVRPGGDFAVLAHLVREVLRDGADVDEVARHARGVGDVASAVEPFDAVTAAAVAGIGIEQLDALLASVREHRHLAVITGTGVTMTAEANVTEWLAWVLLVLTGSLEQPDGMWFNPGPNPGVRPRPGRSRSGAAPLGPPSRPELPRRFGQYPCAALLDEIEQGHVRALLVLGGNPLASFPEPERVRAALASLDVLAVLEIVRTEVTDLATHVLPCAGDLERPEVAAGSVSVIPAIFAQYAPAVFPVGAQRRAAWSILDELAARVAGASLLPEAATIDDEHVLREVMGVDPHGSDIPWGVVQDWRSTLGWVRESVLPDGRWELAPDALVAQLSALAAPKRREASLVLVPRRQSRHMNSALVDVTGDARRDEPWLLVHPDDATRTSVGDGDVVEVRSRHGDVVAQVRIDASLRPGVVSLPHGFASTNVNRLTSSHEAVDALTGMVTLSGVEVELVPRRASATG